MHIKGTSRKHQLSLAIALVLASGFTGQAFAGDVNCLLPGLCLAGGDEIVNGTVDAGDLGTNSVGNDEIQTNAVGSAEIANNSITADDIQAGAVKNSELDTNAVTADKIDAGAVDTSELATDAVTTDKIQDSAVTADKIGTGQVRSDEILDNSITINDIGTGAVGSDEILDNSITINDIGTGAVGSDEILDNSIMINDIGTGAVGSDEILDNSITINDIGTGAVGSDEILNDSITSDDIGILTDLRVMDGNTDMMVDINGFDLDVGVGDSIAMTATDTGVTNDHSDLLLTGTGASLTFTDVSGTQVNGISVDSDSVDIIGGTGTTTVNIGDDLVITTDSMDVTADLDGNITLRVDGTGTGTASMTDGNAVVSVTGDTATMSSSSGSSVVADSSGDATMTAKDGSTATMTTGAAMAAEATVTNDAVTLRDGDGTSDGEVEVTSTTVKLGVDNSLTDEAGFVDATSTTVNIGVQDTTGPTFGSNVDLTLTDADVTVTRSGTPLVTDGLFVGTGDTVLTGGDGTNDSTLTLDETLATLESDGGVSLMSNTDSVVGGSSSLLLDPSGSATLTGNGLVDINALGDDSDVDIDAGRDVFIDANGTDGDVEITAHGTGDASLNSTTGSLVSAKGDGTVNAASSTAGTGDLTLTNTMSSMSGGFGVDRTTLTLDNDGAHLDNHLDMGNNQINNLADGYADFDAVNKRQLDEVDDRAKEGIAAVAAMASIPGPIPGKRYSVGVGVGSYESETALAIGLNAQVTDSIMVKAAAGISDSETTGGVGASFSW